MDLIYCGEQELYNRVKDAVTKQYPSAKIEDASDFIHPYRLSVEAGGEMYDWFRFLIREQIANLSLHVQSALHGADIVPDLHELLKEAIYTHHAIEAGECPHCHERLTQTSDGLTCMVCYHVYDSEES